MKNKSLIILIIIALILGIIGAKETKASFENFQDEIQNATDKVIEKLTDQYLLYQANIQDIGWQKQTLNGKTAGTTGQGKRLEAIKILRLSKLEKQRITYQTYVEDIGWQDWKKEGQTAGAENQSKIIEAIRIKFEETDDNYSIKYRVHVQDIGWQDWCYDGESAGTIGENKRIEAIQIEVVPKVTETKIKLEIEDTENFNKDTKTVSGWVMTNQTNTKLELYIDGNKIEGEFTLKERQDVLNSIKGYGGEITNSKPGFSIPFDFSSLSNGSHKITLKVLNNQGKVIGELTKNFVIKPEIVIKTGVYGKTGLKEIGNSKGGDLTYYQYGSGPNVFFATFAVHGFEDKWDRDSTQLVLIAEEFWSKLQSMQDYNLAEKWTIYIFPQVNPDGRIYGWTNNGPGRTTLTSASNGKGVDINRCWSKDFVANYTNRNYTGSEPFMAYEARYLRDFLLSHKSKDGQTILVDLHGWTQQLIGDSTIRDYYRKQFPENTDTATYGKGYLINWARTELGSSTKAAKSALIELPSTVSNENDVIAQNLNQRYITATLDMLNGIV